MIASFLSKETPSVDDFMVSLCDDPRDYLDHRFEFRKMNGEGPMIVFV